MNYNELNYTRLIGHGDFGEVDLDVDKNICRKRIFIKHTQTEKIIKKIKNLKLYNFYKIYQLRYSNVNRFHEFTGYYMEYYEPVYRDKEDPLRMIPTCIYKPLIFFPIDYVINNYYSLKEDLKTLYDNAIEPIDLHFQNVVLTKEKIVIIDVDNYKYSPLKKKLGKLKSYDIKSLYKEILDMGLHTNCALYYSDELYEYLDFENPKIIKEMKKYSNLYEYIINTCPIAKQYRK